MIWKSEEAYGAAPTVKEASPGNSSRIESLRTAFLNPPIESRPWVYYWLLEGVSTLAGITADLEEMKKQGISGLLVFDAGKTLPPVAKGAKFMSKEWRANFLHTLQEASRLRLEVSVNLCTGWNAGGSWVERDDAIQLLAWRELALTGPRILTEKELTRRANLQSAGGPLTAINPPDWWREIAVIAAPGNATAWSQSSARLLTASGINHMRQWEIPEGQWTVMQFGSILSGKLISFSSFDQQGWEIDPMNRHALDEHFRNTAGRLIEDAGDLAGTTLKYTHIDSWEIGQPTWSTGFAVEFKKRRGYDPTPYLPALAGKVVDSPEVSRRFQYDFRRVMADLVAENYYGRLTELSSRHHLGTDSQAGGPFFNQAIDGLACLGRDTIPMGEFWTGAPLKLVVDEGVSDPFFRGSDLHYLECFSSSVRQAATAARIYGKQFCQAEAYTGYGRDWAQDPDYLKAYGDHAFCLGAGRNVINNYTSVPDFHNPPGTQWEHACFHFNRYVTWWDKSHAWLKYQARCQHLLRQGNFVADILYYCGEAVPNFVLIDKSPLPGYDYDTTNAEALLTRAQVRNGQITFGSGTSYRYLVIPGKAGLEMSVPILKRLRDMVSSGMTLVADPPETVPGLYRYKEASLELHAVAAGMWERSARGEKSVGKGRVIWGTPLAEVLAKDRIEPDVELHGAPSIEWIHRRSANADIYFLSNQSEQPVAALGRFRVAGRASEIWRAVTGETGAIEAERKSIGGTALSLKFEPKESLFVLFPMEQAQRTGSLQTNPFPNLVRAATLEGPWEVSFDPAWGGPAQTTFASLIDWITSNNDGIRYYSGQATYQNTFAFLQSDARRHFLDLGAVKNLAQVYLNGENLGVVWTAPWRVEITGHLKPGRNELKIEVTNLWPNRLIKDATLPPDQRLTKTNVRTYDPVLPKDIQMIWGDPMDEERLKTGKPPELFPSGLLGPVTIQVES